MNEFRIFAHGVDFDPDKYLSSTSLKFEGIFYKDEISKDHPKSSGIYQFLGDGYNMPLYEQEKIAIEYLLKNRDALKELADYPGVTDFILGLQYQIDLAENTVGFCMEPSKNLMRYAIDIGISPTFYVSLERFDVEDDEVDKAKNNIQQNRKPMVLRSNKVSSINKDNEKDEKNSPVLAVTSFLIKEGLTDKELHQVQNKLFNSVDYSLTEICSRIPMVSFSKGFSYVHLDPKVENCFLCEHCGQWATNYKKPNEIQGLPIGYEFEGMMLCDQCACWKNDPHCGWTNKD